MMKYLNVLLLFFFFYSCFGQDTIQNGESQRWKNLYIPKTLLRVGAGYQKSFYGELGLTRRKYSGEDLFIIGTAYYGSIEWNPKILRNTSHVYGLKLGGEITLQPLMLGMEIKFQNNFKESDFVITPKIGIGEGNFTGLILSYVYICYGYNISFNKQPFAGIGSHQFSFFINPILLNRKKYASKLYK